MTDETVPCKQNPELKKKILAFAEVLKTEAHSLGDHGMTEAEFYNSGLFRGTIERIRGQFAASMKEKRDFAAAMLDYMVEQGGIKSWESAGETNRHDYQVALNSGRIAAIELKGCLDGNNTNIFERPPQANEFIIWSVCTNPGADPRHNVWSGIHTRLSAEIIHRAQVVDGLVVWDMACGTLGRPCPKVANSPEKITHAGAFQVPPPCIYLFPSTIPSPRNNPEPQPNTLQAVEILKAFSDVFNGSEQDLTQVFFKVGYEGAETVRTTSMVRSGVTVAESKATPIKRS